MPASTNRNLFLQVGADVSPLQAQMKAGRSALLSLADAAGDVQAEVQKQLAAISADPSSLKQIESSYKATFDNIRRNAQAALAVNDNASALKLIDAQGAQQAAQAAAAQAAQLRLAANAAAAVAERQGEAGVAARVLAAALEVQAVDAAKVSAALNSQAGVMAEVAAEARILGAREDEVSGAHGRLGASGLIADHVIRSFADSVAAGQSPLRAATLEIGRVTEGLILYAQQMNATEGFAGKLAGFLGGPWGIAFTVAAAVLVPLVTELLETEDATKKVEIAENSLAKAQSALGEIFDLTTGKLKKQNGELRLHAELTAASLEAQARQDRIDSEKVLSAAGNAPLGSKAIGGLLVGEGFLSKQLLGRDYLGLGGAGQQKLAGNSDVRQLAYAAQVALSFDDPAARTKALLGVVRNAKNVDFANSGTTYIDFTTAIGKASSARSAPTDAAAIRRSLDTNTLDPRFIQDGKEKKERKPPVDHSAERAANADRALQAELQRANDRVAKAKLGLADTAEARYAVEAGDLITAEKARNQEIDDQVTAKKISAADAAKLKALNQEATGLELLAAQRKEQQSILDRQLAADFRELDAKSALLNLQAGLASTTKERRRIALELLALEEQRARDQANRDILSTDPERQKNGQAAKANVDAQHGLRVQQVNDQTADPLERYKKQLHDSAGDMNDALKSVEADGLKGIEDGFVGIISGTESVASAFKKMADTIISDIARIVVEKALLSFLGFSSGGEVGSVTPIKKAAGGAITGPGSSTSDSILSWLSNGEFVVNAAATRRSLPLLKAINDNRLPGFADGGFVGLASIPTSYPSLPKAEALRNSQQVAVSTRVEIEPSPLFDVRSRTIAQQTVGAAAGPIMSGATTQTMKKLRRQGLPGGYG